MPFPPLDRARLVYRWDLDKTYLRTDFDNIRGLLRAAFETAKKKATIPGASALLREIRATSPAAIYILSGSPEQMRRVLEAKLRLDGVIWDSLTLKPSVRNLLRGRLRFIRDQIGYKLRALLESRVTIDPGLDEVLFGDDAESDAFIYSLYADLCAGRVDLPTLEKILELAQVHEDEVLPLLRLADRLPRRDACTGIFIHLDRTSSLTDFAELGPRVWPFYNYFQPALVLAELGAIDASAALRVGTALVLEHGFSAESLAASYEDLSRRGRIGKTIADGLLLAMETASPGLGRAVRSVFDDLGRRLTRAEYGEGVTHDVGLIDYVGLFGRDRTRARTAKQRVRDRR